MVKRLFLLSSVLFGLLLFIAAGQCFADASEQLKQADDYKQNKQYEQAEAIYQQIVTDYQGTEEAFKAQGNLAMVYVLWRKQPEADAAYQKLLVNFSTHKDIAQAVHDIAYQYRCVNKQQKANQIDQYVADNWPQSDYAVLGQMDLAKYYIDCRDDPNAEAAFDKLLANFSTSPLIARAVHDVAQHYRWSGKPEKANQLYQHVIDHWPKTEHALWSQADLIKSYIALGDDPSAEAAVDKLLANFTDNPLIARAVWDTGQYYRDLKKYQKANWLYQHVVENWPDAEHAMWAQADLIKSCLALGDDTAAQAAVDRLLTNFTDNPLITRAVWDTARLYRDLKKYKSANQLYQHVTDNWPDSEQAMWAQADLIKSYLALSDDPNAQAAVDKLLANFSENPLIARAVWYTGQYYRSLKKYEKANELYQHVTDNWPDTEHALWAQADLIKSCLALGDDTAAQAAVDRLLTNFTDNPLITRAVWDTARLYRDLKKYKSANQLYQHVTDNWPDSEHALWSQADLIKSYLALGDDPNAQAAVDKLLANFTENPLIARAVWDTGQYYRSLKKYEKANRLYQHVVAYWPDREHAMWTQADLIKSLLALGDDPNAETAVEKLLTEFSSHKDIARAIHDTAYEYRKLGNYDKADQLDQYVIDNWPDDEQAMWAKMDMAKTNIVLGNEAAAEAAINELIADFNDHPGVASALFQVGEKYYNSAFQCEKKGFAAKATDNFLKAIEVWERIITELSPSGTTAEAYYFSAVCYRHLEQYETAIEYYQKIVSDWPDYERAWNAQFMIARCFDKLARSGAIPKADAAPIIRHACEKLITNYPNSMAVKAALNLLRRWESVNSK